jgi:hypothetical protein
MLLWCSGARRARRPTMPFPGAQVVIAAAEGAVAALAIDQELFLEDLK